MLLVKFRGGTIVSKLSENFGLCDLIESIRGKYCNVQSNSCTLKYTVGSHADCCLTNEEDFKNTMTLTNLLSICLKVIMV